MDAPKFELKHAQRNGKQGYEVVVRNSMANTELHAKCIELGLQPDCTIANRYSILVFTAQELDNVREPLKPFFVK